MERKMFDTPVLPRLETILAEAKSGDLVLPEFQRPFVWNDDRRLKLLDSIVEGMPIGSLLVWRTTRRDLRTYRTLGGVQLDNPRAGEGKLNYLIDGHQRISTLFGALYPGERQTPGDNNDDDVRWPIYYELGSARRPAFRVPPRRLPIQEHWLPLSILFDGDKLFEFTQRLRLVRKRDLAKQAERLANIFRDYIIPIIPLVTDDLNVVTDAFVRVNSQGKTMSEAHMLRALTHVGEADTDKQFRKIRRQLEPLGWATLDDQVLVNVLKAQLRLDIYLSDVRGVHDSLKANPAHLTKLGHAVEEAVGFLAEVGVRGPSALPYTYQLVTLAALSAWTPGILNKPSNKKLLRRWFWTTTYTELYSGITGAKIREAIEDLQTSLKSGQRSQSADLAPVKPLTRIRAATGRASAFFLFLAQLPQTQAAKEARQEKLGYGAVANLISSKKAADPGNRIIADPSDLRKIRPAMRSNKITSAMADEFAIPEDALKLLPNSDAFLKARRNWLVTKEREFIESFDLVVDE